MKPHQAQRRLREWERVANRGSAPRQEASREELSAMGIGVVSGDD